MSFKNLFKRKPGGTFVGNLLRGTARSVSGGILGNGLMKIDANETEEEYKERVVTMGKAAVVGGTEAAKGAKKDTEKVQKFKIWWVKNRKTVFTILGALTGLIVIVLIVKIAKGKKRRRRR